MPSRVEVMHQVVAMQKQRGMAPMEIHANHVTVNEFVAEAKLLPVVPKDTRSPIEKMLGSKPAPAACFVFDGCTLVVNNRIVGPALLIRPAILMGDDEWLNKLQWHPASKGPQGEQLIMPEGRETPWQQPADQSIAGIATEATKATEGTLQALQQAGGVSCTDVLCKAMDGLDSVEHVLVVRYHKSGDIDLCTTLDRFGVHGAINKVAQYVMRHDD